MKKVTRSFAVLALSAGLFFTAPAMAQTTENTTTTTTAANDDRDDDDDDSGKIGLAGLLGLLGLLGLKRRDNHHVHTTTTHNPNR
ncbi:WGxxGxxG family protein [Flaviaesturariibacter amylovorans]|uniref:WGxxGxxG-CTERM domain-containing protein n=1 Tax=Flaviaesturariibacter amylovorans TaxID=1084520 RepID=A0ABP8H8D1_9BACT